MKRIALALGLALLMGCAHWPYPQDEDSTLTKTGKVGSRVLLGVVSLGLSELGFALSHVDWAEIERNRGPYYPPPAYVPAQSPDYVRDATRALPRTVPLPLAPPPEPPIRCVSDQLGGYTCYQSGRSTRHCSPDLLGGFTCY